MFTIVRYRCQRYDTSFWKPQHEPNRQLPHGRYLIFHLEGPEAAVDGVQDVVSLVAAPPPVEAGHNNPMRAGEVSAPVELEAIVHLLAAGAGVPARAQNTRQQPAEGDALRGRRRVLTRQSEEGTS